MRELLASTEVRQIRIYSRDEEKQDAMRREHTDARLSFYIGDIRDRHSIDHAMRGVDYVFHAAALKQVPSCEFFPIQAVETNILGSNNVLLSAIDHEVSSVVCLSTDKAVFPINAMGMTKGLMEKVVQSIARRHEQSLHTTMSCVRYGNVMYSRGSVIPLFIRQLKEGKPLTLTDPGMTRFLMPLTDSVALVQHAFMHAKPGDIFIKKAPACTLEVLVQALKNLFDATDTEVKIIGTRHGEKIYETLASAAELARSEDHGEYFRIAMDGRGLNYEEYVTEGDTDITTREDYHSSNTTRLDVKGVEALLLQLPEVRQELASHQLSSRHHTGSW